MDCVSYGVKLLGAYGGCHTTAMLLFLSVCRYLMCTRTVQNYQFGERGFSFSGPAAWNRLSADLQRCSDTDGFKKKLKTFLFQLAFN